MTSGRRVFETKEKNMSVQAKQLISVEEYLAMERATPEKHQYLDGEVFAMGGASYNHTLITINVVAGLHTQFREMHLYGQYGPPFTSIS